MAKIGQVAPKLQVKAPKKIRKEGEMHLHASLNIQIPVWIPPSHCPELSVLPSAFLVASSSCCFLKFVLTNFALFSHFPISSLLHVLFVVHIFSILLSFLSAFLMRSHDNVHMKQGIAKIGFESRNALRMRTSFCELCLRPATSLALGVPYS